jgi:hypothetical protein
VLHGVETWAGTLNGPCVFWLNDPAGTGNSSIAATVCQFLDQKQLLGASFFIRREQADSRNPSKIVLSIAHQLAMCSSLMGEALCTTLRVCPASYRRSVQEQITDFIIEPARVLDGRSTLCIVVDALDDCFLDEDEQSDGNLLLILFQQLPSLSGRLKLFVTSRGDLASQIRNHYDYKKTTQWQQVVKMYNLDSIIELPGEQGCPPCQTQR